MGTENGGNESPADLLRRAVTRVEDLAAGEKRVRALLDAVVAVGEDLDLHGTLQRVVAAAAELAHARYVALGVLDSAGEQLSDFITWGVDDEQRQAIGPLPRGHGILGLLISDPRPLRLHDLHEHRASYGFPDNHPPMATFLGVPVRGRGRIFGNLYLTEKEDGGDFSDDDERAVVALAAAAGVAIENARLFEQTQRRERWLDATTQIQQLLLRAGDPVEVLDVVASKARTVAEADVALIVLEEDDGRLYVQAASGGAPTLLRAELPRSGPLIDVLERGATVRLAAGIPLPGVEDVRSALLVPFSGPGGAAGALLVATAAERTGTWPADDDVVAMRGFAAQATLALDRAQAREDRVALAVYSDRDRIARDLHDLVIQRLFATGLSLQGTARLTARPEVERRVRDAVSELDQTIRDIRGTIFALNQPTSSTDLRAEIGDVVTAAAANIDASVNLALEGPVDSAVPDEVRPHLVAVLVESLSNASRHSRAETIEVRVAIEDGQVILSVTDDGQGFTPTGRESGLANLRRRAHEVDGACEVVSSEGAGTQVRWCAPLVRPDAGRQGP